MLVHLVLKILIKRLNRLVNGQKSIGKRFAKSCEMLFEYIFGLACFKLISMTV